jgi:DNA-3-methyladenine glycosylase
VTEGLDTARARRPGSSDRDLARGPARLCKALGIGLSDNGADLVAGPTTLVPSSEAAAEVSRGPRVGLRGDADLPWRFWLPGEPTVSAYRPAVTRPRPAKGL